MVHHLYSQHPMTGGIRLAGRKKLSSEAKIVDYRQADTDSEKYTELENNECVLPLSMHAGKPAKPIVEVGAHVKIGAMIAKADTGISAAIHSPVNGTIKEIAERPVMNRSGLNELCIVITSNHKDASDTNDSINHQLNPNSVVKQILPLDRNDLIERIKQAGIVGLGGAGFPTHIKLMSQSDMLIINGVECEPYITCDDRTLREFSTDVLSGALIMAHIINSSTIHIAIEDNKPVAINAMLQVIEDFYASDSLNASGDASSGRSDNSSCAHSSDTSDETFNDNWLQSLNINVIEIPTMYPSGGEKQLIERILGKQVSSGKLPSSLNLTMQNVGTTLAVFDAVIHDKNLIDRIITVTGDSIEKPGNYRVPVGTSVRNLLDFAGWNESETQSIIHGGPMMGYAIADPDRPIVKTTNCIIAASKTEFSEPLQERPCIRCGKCAEVCPASLLPQQLYWYSKSDEINRSEEYRLFDCIECGACSYVCPSEIPLVDYYRYSKAEILNRKKLELKAEHSKQRFEFKQHRQELAALEKKRLK